MSSQRRRGAVTVGTNTQPRPNPTTGALHRWRSHGRGERAAFDETYAAAALAIRVGEQIRDARERAGLSQRDLAELMGTSQAAIARLEAGGVSATLTTLQRAASALNLNVTVELRPAS